MKKPDRKRLLLLTRRAERRILREYRKRKSRKVRRIRRSRQSRQYHLRTVKIHAPVAFRIASGDAEHRETLLTFLARVEAALARGSRVRILFEQTKTLSPDGTLLFVATIQSLSAAYPGRISSDYPADDIVEQLFQHIGLLDELGNSPRKVVTADNVKYWHFLQGTIADPSGFMQLFAAFASQIGSETSAGLYESMSEAITNVVQHAYDGLRPESLAAGVRWWMFAQQKDDRLDVAICDLGIGIPKSLAQKPEMADVLPNLLRRLHKRRSSGLIEVAVESSRSRTRLPHRGKGLPDMLIFSKNCKLGGFFVHSDTGFFMYRADLKRESGRDHKTKIPGTLIHWQLDLPK